MMGYVMQEKADKNGDVVETVKEEMDPNFPMHEDVNGEYVEVRRDMCGYPVNEIENGLDIAVYLNDKEFDYMAINYDTKYF